MKKIYRTIILLCMGGLMVILASCAITRLKPVSYKLEATTTSGKEAVVLLHGLGRSAMSMYFLGSYLSKNGYTVYIYDYPSSRFTIGEHASGFKKFIEDLSSDKDIDKIHFVTHSLGGIVARKALSGNRQSKIGRMVMLAPPNSGSTTADFACNFPFISTILLPLQELKSGKKSPIHDIPIPEMEIGIISGKYDRKVKVSETYLKQAHKYLIINSSHTFIMNKSRTKSAVLHFLLNGDFGSDTTLH
jgi:esterase/lipase